MSTIGIVARSLDNYIGLEIDGKHMLPWKDKIDLIHFKNITNGHFVVMGRKTVESLPKKLEGRKVICLTRNKNYINEKADYVAHSIEEVYNIVGDSILFVAGGKSIYEAFADKMTTAFITTIYLTRLEFAKYDEQNISQELTHIGSWIDKFEEENYINVGAWDTGMMRAYTRAL